MKPEKFEQEISEIRDGILESENLEDLKSVTMRAVNLLYELFYENMS